MKRYTALALTAALLIPLSASASLFGNISGMLGTSSTTSTYSSTSTSSSTTGRTCSQETATLYVSTCQSVWSGSKTSLAMNQVPSSSGSLHQLSVCYDRNVCECVSAYTTTGSISSSDVQSCNAAVGSAYFSKIQTTKVAAAKAAASASAFFSGIASLAEAGATGGM